MSICDTYHFELMDEVIELLKLTLLQQKAIIKDV